MNFILRAYSFVFLVPLSLFFFAMGCFAYLEGGKELTIEMLPWAEANVRAWILTLSVFGLISIWLAARKTARVLYAMYGAIVFCLAAYAVFLSRYQFDGLSEFYWGLAFVAGAFGAMMGAIVHARK